jgi:hypothetical protein
VDVEVGTMAVEEKEGVAETGRGVTGDQFLEHANVKIPKMDTSNRTNPKG